ncbi:MAG TPA: ADP-ribosylglycohydrolase family protein [Thermoanaerobaculia bacterium]|nr:ADP-ribosylglycohydrolase family protein [Thermoanaerobaculia bacterium]
MSITKPPSRDQVLGCLLGGAVGDAFCGVAERGRISLSDDTQLTLATCESLAALGGVDPAAIAASLLAWYRAGAVSGLGSSTFKALRDLDAGAHWALSGARGERAAGNGAAMRIAPLAFLLDPNEAEHRVTIRDVCRITHHSDEAYLGALAILLALRADALDLVNFRGLANALPDSRVRDRLLEFDELPAKAPLLEVAGRFGCSGYVVETVPLALFAAWRVPEQPLGGVLAELRALPGDADTLGALTGQLVGFRLGTAALPEELLALEAVRGIAHQAAAMADALSAWIGAPPR